MITKNYRIGLIVPSSNTTMEKEIPEMLGRRQRMFESETFTFHSSRMRMKTVSKEELIQMDIESDRCALELSDAQCDSLAYACLVAIMSQGSHYHITAERRLTEIVHNNGLASSVISSAGALVNAVDVLGVKKVAMITPYMKPLTQLVIDYLEFFGIQVVDSISLEVSDNLEVGRLDPLNLIDIAKQLDLTDADAVILSACVQMQSLPAIDIVEKELNLPVLSAATSTVYQILKQLNIQTYVPKAGKLLSGEF